MKIDLELVRRFRILGLTDVMIASYFGMNVKRFTELLKEQSESKFVRQEQSNEL